MRVLAYDPYLTLSRANALQVELLELDDVLARADFITARSQILNQRPELVDC